MSSSSFAALASKPAAEKEKASVPETPPLHSVQIDVRGDEFVSVSVAIVFGE